MSVKAQYEFTCDFCGYIRYKDVPVVATPVIKALPPGWQIVIIKRKTQGSKKNKHICPECFTLATERTNKT